MIGSVLCVWIVALFLAALLGGGILRVACALYNKMAGAAPPRRGTSPDWGEPSLRRPRAAEAGEGITESPEPFDYQAARKLEDVEQRIRANRGVPEPELGTAMLIAFVSLLVNTSVGVVISFSLAGVQIGFGGTGGGGHIVANLLSLPIGILVLGGMASAMLPTTFRKGMLVTLLYLAIALAIAVVIGGCALGVMLALGGKWGKW